MTKLELLGLKSIRRKAAEALDAIDFVQKNLSADDARVSAKVNAAWNKLTDVVSELKEACDD